MGIGANIKHLLKEQNKTVTWLSKDSHINRNTLYSIIRKDDTSVRKENLAAIAKSLNVSVKDLFSDTTEPSVRQIKSDSESTTTPHNSISNKQSVPLQLSDKEIKRIDRAEFFRGLKKRKTTLKLWHDFKGSDNIPPAAAAVITERKEMELQLLADFFELHPIYRKRALNYINQLLVEQIAFGPPTVFYDLSDPEDFDRFLKEQNIDPSTLSDGKDFPEPTEEELDERYRAYEEAEAAKAQAKEKLKQYQQNRNKLLDN